MDTEEYLIAWNKRLRTPIAEYIILWKSAFSTKSTYPYMIHGILVDLWTEEHAPALRTIYSTIKRLEKEGLLRTHQEIVDSRAQKIITATKEGINTVETMRDSFEKLTQSLERYELDD